MSSRLRKSSVAVALTVLLGAGAAFFAVAPLAPVAVAQTPIIPTNPTPIPHTPYHGPGDLPITGGQGATYGTACNNAGLTAGCGVCLCDTMYATPFNLGCIPDCACDGPGHHPQHQTLGFDITLGDLKAFVNDPVCSAVQDADGKCTMCLGPFDDVCEVYGQLYSALIKADQTPIPSTVPVQICANGARLSDPSLAPLNHGLTEKRSECLQCGDDVRVQLTFNKECMKNAIRAWTQYWATTGQPDWGRRAIHVGVILCTPCEN